MSDPRENLVALDAKLGRTWAKVEILVGLFAGGCGLFLPDLSAPSWSPPGGAWHMLLVRLTLFVLGSYLTLAGHRSHQYRWNNRNTVVLIDEIRRLQDRGYSA